MSLVVPFPFMFWSFDCDVAMYTKKLSGTDEAFALTEDDPDVREADIDACEAETTCEEETCEEEVCDG